MTFLSHVPIFSLARACLFHKLKGIFNIKSPTQNTQKHEQKEQQNWSVLEPTVYHTWSKHANRYTTDTVSKSRHTTPLIYIIFIPTFPWFPPLVLRLKVSEEVANTKCRVVSLTRPEVIRYIRPSSLLCSMF